MGFPKTAVSESVTLKIDSAAGSPTVSFVCTESCSSVNDDASSILIKTVAGASSIIELAISNDLKISTCDLVDSTCVTTSAAEHIYSTSDSVKCTISSFWFVAGLTAATNFVEAWIGDRISVKCNLNKSYSVRVLTGTSKEAHHLQSNCLALTRRSAPYRCSARIGADWAAYLKFNVKHIAATAVAISTIGTFSVAFSKNKSWSVARAIGNDSSS